MNWKCVQFRNKVLVNCERRPGSAGVDQFDRLRDRSNTHVLFSESSLAQCGVEQFTTTSPRQKAEVLCTRTEFLIDSALTVPLWSWKVTVHCSLCSSHLTTSETVLQKQKTLAVAFSVRNQTCLASTVWLRTLTLCFHFGFGSETSTNF